jgi:diacylglycerol kinase family enzyme
MKRRLGAFAYVVGVARALRRPTLFRAEIVTPDERLVLRTFGLTVGNGRFFGGSGIVAEDAAIDDGLLHVFVLTTKNPLRLLLLLPSLTRGRKGSRAMIRRLAAPSLEVHTLRSMPIRADGSSASETPAVFKVRRAALQVFAPP